MSLNINGNKEDTTYRYKMPELKSSKAGKGNGSFTLLLNLNNVAKALGHPVHTLFKFMSLVLGSSCNESKMSLTGHHNNDDLIKIIYQYINFYVICPKCGIPELIPELQGKKKRKFINIHCSACGHSGKLNNSGKHFDKGLNILIKYLEKNKWEIVKGNMVEQSFDPFSSLMGIDDTFF